MYISKIHIRNYRCYNNMVVDFSPGVNVIIGENNSGKSALLKALGLLFNRKGRGRPDFYDFYQGIGDFTQAPFIEVTVTLCSSEDDALEDKALVATWLTKLEAPWEAQLTYRFVLPEEEKDDFERDLGINSDKKHFWDTVKRYLPKYIGRIYGGNLSAQIRAEPDALSKFDYQFLDAIRDVETELFSGSNPLLKAMLREVLDYDLEAELDKSVKSDKQRKRREAFKEKSDALIQENLIERLGYKRLFELTKETGAEDGGVLNLQGEITEDDLIAALRLFVSQSGFDLPADHNGLGYNNLIYIALVLANLDFEASPERRGQNAVLFPMLVIEEPEAHLHPALQYKLLKYIQRRQPQRNRQVFITTHSTHITAAAGLDPIICMSINDEGGTHVAYPGRVFDSSISGVRSKKYVERYLDATKSNMLFSKGIIFVEGISEQLLIPCLAQYIDELSEQHEPISDHHVAVIAVGGVSFKHFLPIFGAVDTPEQKQIALKRRVACVIDADPTRKDKTKPNSRHKKCWPYQLGADGEVYDYQEVSGSVANLKTQCDLADTLAVFHGNKTLEYDLAYENNGSSLLLTANCRHVKHLQAFIDDPTGEYPNLDELLAADSASPISDLARIGVKSSMYFATLYLLSVENAKGEHAFDLEYQLRQNLEYKSADNEESDDSKDDSALRYENLVVPQYIKDAILWACRVETGDGEK